MATRRHRRIRGARVVLVRLSHGAQLHRPGPRPPAGGPGALVFPGRLRHAGLLGDGHRHELHALQPPAITRSPSPAAARPAAPRSVPAARHRRVHAGAPAPRRPLGHPDGGPGPRSTWPAPTPSPTSSTRSRTPSSTPPSSPTPTATPGHCTSTTCTTTKVQDQWGTANPVPQLVAKESFNDPDPEPVHRPAGLRTISPTGAADSPRLPVRRLPGRLRPGLPRPQRPRPPRGTTNPFG